MNHSPARFEHNMEEHTDTLYRKVGRRYKPAFSERSAYESDLMTVGTFRLTHAYADGGRRYHYDVTPDTAAVEAAFMLAGHAMREAMLEASRYSLDNGAKQLTKRQQDAVKQAREILESAGLLAPAYWRQRTADEIVEIGIAAVRSHKPQPR
jgi:hypothetical protein